MYFVSVAEIDWIEAFGNYARLHTGQRTHLIRETMATLERALDARRFARIHRSTIVNLDRIHANGSVGLGRLHGTAVGRDAAQAQSVVSGQTRGETAAVDLSSRGAKRRGLPPFV